MEGRDVIGEVGRPIPLKVSIRQTGDVTVEGIRLLGLPPGSMVGDLVHIVKSNDGDDIVDLTDWSLADLRITLPEKASARFKLSFSVIWKPRSSESIEVSSAEFTVRTVAGPGTVRPGQARPGGDTPSADAAGAETRVSDQAAREAAGPPALRRPTPNAALPGANPPRSDGPGTTGAGMTGADMTGAAARPDPGRERGEARAPAALETRPRPAAPSGTAPAPPVAADSLVERARGLIKRGDISGARLFLERARARNEPEATYLLAQTWDPEVLQRWNVLGLRPDPERARALYAEAAERARGTDPSLAATRR